MTNLNLDLPWPGQRYIGFKLQDQILEGSQAAGREDLSHGWHSDSILATAVKLP